MAITFSRRDFMRRSAGVACGAALLSAGGRSDAAARPNVLFIAVDDLNDWIGCLGGHSQAKTPHIDRLAQRGVLFTNAHCQAPICGPSRTSLMTGLLPSTTGQYENSPHFRDGARLKDAVTLTQHFSKNGYKTFGVGKIFHGGHPDPQSFDVNGPRPGQGPTLEKKLSYTEGVKLWDWGAFALADEETHDYQDASWAIERLGEFQEQPFFLGLGFYRPHVPMYAPKKWFDLYPIESIKLPRVLADDRDDLPDAAIALAADYAAPPHAWMVEHGEWKHAVQSYLACISFMDHQVGRVLDALDASGKADNTIIVLFSDHGFHLGEKQRWAKRTLWKRSTRVPLMISAPGMASGRTCARPVGLIDLYPTLIQLCGIDEKPGLEGRSIAPLLREPAAAWERPAITTFRRNNHAIRSERWRYIRYADGSEELYDHSNDPHEWRNLAGAPEYAEIIRKHARWLPKVNVPEVKAAPKGARRK